MFVLTEVEVRFEVEVRTEIEVKTEVEVRTEIEVRTKIERLAITSTLLHSLWAKKHLFHCGTSQVYTIVGHLRYTPRIQITVHYIRLKLK